MGGIDREYHGNMTHISWVCAKTCTDDVNIADLTCPGSYFFPEIIFQFFVFF